MFDYIIKNAMIIDGSGAPAYQGSLAIYGDRIKILRKESFSQALAKEEIDASGKYVCPGFIDAHTHGDAPLGEDFASKAKLSQGITTQVAGMCGMSMAPIRSESLSMLQDSMGMLVEKFPSKMERFTTFERYLDYANSLSVAENTKFLVGHLTLRVAAMGYENREPTAAELANMKAMLIEALEAGAGGMSSGLIYVPSAYGQEAELTELCKVVAKYGGIYTTHMRNESKTCIQSVEESIRTAKHSGVDLIISHHKLAGKENWGNSKVTLAMIDQANEEGVSVNCDQYPYTAAMTQLAACAPPKYYTNGLAGMVNLLQDPSSRDQIRREMEDPNTDYDNYFLNSGGWEGVLISKSAQMPEVEGRFVSEIAHEQGKDPFDVYCEIMTANHGVATAIYFYMCEEDIFRIIGNDHVVVGTDGILRAANDKPHPRAFGTFPHAIRVFVKENHLMSLEKMIHKMTGLTATICKIPDRGLIRDGYKADLILFDYEQLCDRANYQNPTAICDGLEYVFVNGKIVYKGKELTGVKPGELILMQ